MSTYFTENLREGSIVSSDGVNTQYSGVSFYPTTFQGTAETRRTERESRMAEMETIPFQGISGNEAVNYQNYFNTTLSYVDQLRYPENLPDLGKLAKKDERKEGGQGSSEAHGSLEAHGAHGGPEAHSGSEAHVALEEHGNHETKKKFIEITHATEGIHKSAEEISRIARTERGTVPVARALEASAAELGEASAINNVANTPVTAPSSLSGTTNPVSGTSSAPLKYNHISTNTSPLEAVKAPLKEPISWDMQQYVDAVRESKVPEVRPGLTAPNASSVTAEAGTAPVSAGARPASALATESSEAGQAMHSAGHSGGFHKVMGTAEKVLAPAAVLAGGLELAHGISELKEGKTVLGTLDVAGGAAGVTGGAAATVNAFGLATAPATAAALGTVAGVGFGAVAVIDGAKTIYEGIKEKDTEKTVIGGVKTAAGGAMIAGVCTGNPVLVVGGAVTYAGAVIYENREAIADGAKKAYHYTADKVGQGVQATRQFAGNVAHSVSTKAQSIKHEVGALIDSGVNKAGELKDAAVHKAGELKDAAVHKAGELKDAAVHKAGELKDAAVHKAGELKDAAVHKAAEVKDAVVHKAAEVKQAVGSAISSAGSTISGAASATADGAKSAWKWATSWI